MTTDTSDDTALDSTAVFGATLQELRALRQAVVSPEPPSALLERKDLATMLAIGTTALDTLRAAGKIGPAEIRVGGGVRWHAEEVGEWLRRRAPDGELYDHVKWPLIWEQIQKQRR